MQNNLKIIPFHAQAQDYLGLLKVLKESVFYFFQKGFEDITHLGEVKRVELGEGSIRMPNL